MTIWRIGAKQTYKHFHSVLNVHYGSYRVADGDTVLVDAGEYMGDPVYLKDSITLKAVGGRVRLFWKDAVQVQISGPTLTYTNALMDLSPADKTKRIDIYDFDFIGAGDARDSGSLNYQSGVRFMGGRVYFHNCRFYNNSNGIMTVNEDPAISELHLINCGLGGGGGAGEGFAHNIYVGRIKKFTMTGCYSHDVRCGHLVKSRAERTELWYNRLTDEAGWGSHQIDTPNGGMVIAVGNLLHKGTPTNPYVVAYGVEGYVGAGGVPWPVNELYVVNNTFVCDQNPGGSNTPIFLSIDPRVSVAKKIMNNIAYAAPGIAPWPTTTGFSNNFNLVTDDMPGMAAFDYRLTEKNGWGTTLLALDPGVTSDGISLKPTKEYAHIQKTTSVPAIYVPGGMQSRRDVGAATAPSWAPAAGQIKTISYAAGTHPAGVHGGAVLSEIDPTYQVWNPHTLYPALYSVAGPWPDTVYGYYFGTITAYGGMSLNNDTRQLTGYGGGHSACNVPAPFAFDLNDLTWKWLDVPPPSDGLQKLLHNGLGGSLTKANLELYYPPEQIPWGWADWNGGWSGWPVEYARPGKIFPEPGHTRGTLMHIPASGLGNAKGALFKTDGSTGANGSTAGVSSHLFDYDSSSWSRTVNQHGTNSSNGVLYDAVTNKVFAAYNGPVHIFDVATRTWTTNTATNTFTLAVDNGGHALHVLSRIYLATNGVTDAGVAGNGYDNATGSTRFRINAAHLDDILSGTFTWATLNVVAATTWPLRTTGCNFTIGWAYCPVNGCLYCVNGCHGSTSLWKLSPPVGAITKNDYLTGTWIITEEVMASGALNAGGAGKTSMVYNRLCWDTPSRSFIWTPQQDNGAVQAIRPLGL